MNATHRLRLDELAMRELFDDAGVHAALSSSALGLLPAHTNLVGLPVGRGRQQPIRCIHVIALRELPNTYAKMS